MEKFKPSEIENAKTILTSTLLKDLVAENSNRLKVLCDFLSKANIPYKILTLENHKHCIIRFEQNHYTTEYYTKNLIAHYDRYENRFGANDNSAACVQLAFFANSLKDEKHPHNIQIIFTDGEETKAKSLRNQGSFFLGLSFRHLESAKKQVALVFDMCGRGEKLVFSEAGIFLREETKTKKLKLLQKLCIKCAKNADLPFTILPTAFSDNAGLLATGINSQLITLLPKIEAQNFLKALTDLKCKVPQESFDKIIKAGIIETNEKINLDKIKPKTWNLMHTSGDSLETLNVEAFASMARYLNEVKKLKIKTL